MKKPIKKDGQLLVIFKQIKYFMIKILVITIAYCKFKQLNKIKVLKKNYEYFLHSLKFIRIVIYILVFQYYYRKIQYYLY